MFDWLYQRMVQYYELMNGQSLAENMAAKIDNEYKAFTGEGAEYNLPLFLNRAFAAFGSISILKSKRKVKRGIEQWSQEDLEILEIGNREFHEQQLPVITLEKVMCTPNDGDNFAGCIIKTAVCRDRKTVLYEFQTRFAYRKQIQGIYYLERVRDYADSHVSVDRILHDNNVDVRSDFVTLKFTLLLPNKKEEVFEFDVMALSRSFYAKAVNYVDFFDRKYVLVIKNLKLHGNCTYDAFTDAFERQNVFVDDFNSSRIKMPLFSPTIYHLLNQSLLSGRLQDFFNEDVLCGDDVEDEYLTKFYSVKFGQMRYDLIESNFIKAKIDRKLWWDFAQSLKVSEAINSLLSYTPAVFEVAKLRENIGAYICPDDRRGFNEILCLACAGIKSDVRPIFWQKVSSKDNRQRVTDQLNTYSPKIVDQLYKLVNAKNTYDINCLFRNHQRIVTHYMKILEDVACCHADEARQRQRHAVLGQGGRARRPHAPRIQPQRRLPEGDQRDLAAVLTDARDSVRQVHVDGLLPPRVGLM